MDEVPLDIEDHPWLQPLDDTERVRLDGLRRQQIIDGQRAISWEALAELDEVDRARELIPVDSPWDRFFSMVYRPSYRELMLQFMMTFRFLPVEEEQQPPEDAEDPNEIHFALFTQRFQMSLQVFAIRMGLYTQEETETEMYTQAIHTMDMHTLERFWFMITGRVHRDHEDRRASDITDPLHRYIHMLIATSISPRHRGREHVTDGDLFYLYCIIRRQHCQLARCLAQFFHSSYHRRARSRLYGGAFITILAHSFGFDPAGHPLVSAALPPVRIDTQAIRSMRLTVTVDGHTRFSDGRGGCFHPEPLPLELPQLPGAPAPAQDAAMPDQPAPHPPPPPHQDPPPHQPPPPPQHPEHVFRVVMLPPATQARIDAIERDVVHMRALLGWLVDREVERAQSEGRVLPPVPAPPADHEGAGPPADQ